MATAAPHHLKLSQLRLVAAIARQGQLGLAAADCAMTQPAASRMLAEIERNIGARIAERQARGLTLTLIGRALARRADTVLTELGDLGREVEELQRGTIGAASVGAVTGGALGYLVPAIAQLKAVSPNAAISVDVAPSGPLVRDLAAGRLDFALARLPDDLDPADFDCTPARHEIVELLVHESHPLASARQLRFGELSSYPFVMQPRGMPIRTAVDQAFIAAGAAPPHDVIDTTSLLVMTAMTAETNAISPVSREVAELLTGAGIRSRLRPLGLAEPIIVAP
jgi:DNA-binding transcriptional LysR family regulator